MRTPEEITQAHDLLLALILGDVKVDVPVDVRPILHAQADVLCWMLGHEHNTTFSDNLDRMKEALRMEGYFEVHHAKPVRAADQPPADQNENENEKIERELFRLFRDFGARGAVLALFYGTPGAERCEVVAAVPEGEDLAGKLRQAAEQAGDGGGMPLGRHGKSAEV